MEEGGGSIEELGILARSFDLFEDLHSALGKLDRQGLLRSHVPTWRLMSKLIMALSGRTGWQGTLAAREYQASELGRFNGDTFLAELMPLPARGISIWPYESLFPTRSDYEANVRPGRIRRLRSEISAFKPPFVICYGKGNWDFHKEIFDDVTFRSELDDEILVGLSGGSTILLLPTLSYYLMMTNLISKIAGLFGPNQQSV